MNKVYFPRKLYPGVKEHLSSNDVTIITGMRRTGKTTLVEHLLSEIDSPNKVFLDLEKISNQGLFSDKNYDNVVLNLEKLGLSKAQRMYVALDEIQKLPHIASVIKYLHDHYDIKFILTGSISYYLKNVFTESLSGRKKLFELYPLDFGEFLTFKNVSHSMVVHDEELLRSFNKHEYARLRAYYEEYVEFGGFPRVVLAVSSQEKKDILDDIISSYINIDIKSISDFKDGSAIVNIARMLAGRVGTRLDYSKISRLTGLSRPTVQNYIYLFERTYLISLVPAYARNQDREIVKAKKIYFSDNGLLGILADIDSGARFENALFNQLRNKWEVAYYAQKSGKEIDFVVERSVACEAKETPTETDKKNLTRLAGTIEMNKHVLIGRHETPHFEDYLWGGEIQ